MRLIVELIDLYSLIVFVAVVVSWIQLPPGNPVVTFVRTMTEPALEPIRRVMPDMGGIDFSPMVLLVGLQLLRGLFLF
jgi:YggT family protein